MSKGLKYPKRKINENPGPGTYSSSSYSVTKKKITDVKISKPYGLYKKPRENLPDPGQYQSGKLTGYSRNAKNATINGPSFDDERLKFKNLSTPGPGSYSVSPLKPRKYKPKFLGQSVSAQKPSRNNLSTST